MKNFKKLFLLLAIGTIGLASCSKTDNSTPNNPSIVVTPTSQTAGPGDVILFQVVANQNTTSTSALTSLEVNIQSTSGTIGTYDSTYALSKVATYGRSVYFVVPASASANSMYTITFTIKDNAGLTSTTTSTVTVKATVQSFTGKTLGAQGATAGSFYGSASGNIFTRSQAYTNQSSVDYVYFYDGTEMATIAAPSDAYANTNYPSYFSDATTGTKWTVENATMLQVLSGVTFSSIVSTADVKNAYTSATGTASTSATNLTVGSVVAFKTAAGKYGVFNVTALDATNSGSITYNVIVQL